MIFCNTYFWPGDCLLTFNITPPPQTTFMNKMQTYILFSLGGGGVDLHDFCQQATDCKKAPPDIWTESSAPFILTRPPPSVHAPKPLKRQSITVFTDHKAMLRIFEKNTILVLWPYIECSWNLLIISPASESDRSFKIKRWFWRKLSERQSMFCGLHFQHSEKKRESVKLEGEMLGVVASLETS